MRWQLWPSAQSRVARRLSPRSRLLLAMTLLALFGLLHQQVVGMDGVFFQRSPSGAKALLLYLAGNYGDA